MITPPPAANRFLVGYTVTFTKPDGNKDTIGPYNSYIADGTSWFQYTVDYVGNWKYKFDFQGEYFPAGYYLNGALMTNTSGTNYPSMYYKPASTQEQQFTIVPNQVLLATCITSNRLLGTPNSTAKQRKTLTCKSTPVLVLRVHLKTF